MHEQDMAIVRALVPVAWADGVFAETEKQTLLALLDAYNATPSERADLLEYAKEKRTLDDIDLQELSADDRRVLLNHAVLVCHVDNDFSAPEVALLNQLATKLKIPEAEAKAMIVAASERAKRLVSLL